MEQLLQLDVINPLDLTINNDIQWLVTRDLKRIQLHRDLVRWLYLDVIKLLHRGEREFATVRTLQCFKVCRQIQKMPTIICGLVHLGCQKMAMNAAVELLRFGSCSPDEHRDIDIALQRNEDEQDPRHILHSDALHGYIALKEKLGTGFFGQGLRNYQLIRYIEAMNRFLAFDFEIYHSFADSRDVIYADRSNPMYRLLFPPIGKFHDSYFATQCQLRCLRVLNAIVAQQVPWAEANIQNLGLPAPATTDPFSGQPLNIVERDGSLVVYGVGENMQDDLGVLEKNLDAGLKLLAKPRAQK